jgi:NhaA family Na+:H+ antiporter
VTEFTKKTINLLQEFSVPLITGVILALIWANISPETYIHIIDNKIVGNFTLHFLVNEIFMAFFFCNSNRRNYSKHFTGRRFTSA